MIPRPRVERTLLEATTRAPLTLVQAPMGAGKSVAAALTFSDESAAWMNARPWHRAAFAAAMVEAVRSLRPDFGRMTLGAVEAGAQPRHLGRLFAAELAHVESRLVLVIDDAHALAGDTAFADFLDAAVDELPATAHILVLGRAIPQIAPSRALERGITMLDGRFLALDNDELRALATTFGRTLEDGAAEEMARVTEGWVAGAALALAGWNEPDLAAHIFGEIGDEHARTLEELSVFAAVDVHVLQQHDSFAEIAASLEDMRARGAPIDRIADGSYRVHPLLRNLARERLRARGGESDAQRRAMQIRARSGHLAAALHHADAAADSATAGAFLRTHALAAIATGDRARIRALAARIDASGPDADVRAYTEGLLDKAAASAQARAAFARAAQNARTSGDELLAFNASIQLLEYDIGHLVHVDEAALDEAARSAARLGPVAQTAIAVLRGWARAVAFDFAAALEGLPAQSEITDVVTRFNAAILRAYVQTSLGEIDAAQETLDELTRLLEDDDRAVLQTLALVWFARLALLWGRIDAAAEAGEHAARLAAALDLRAEEAALYIALAEIATHTGDVTGAVRYAERARQHADRAWYAADVGRIRGFSEIALARAAFLGHDNAIAFDLARRAAEQRDMPPVQRAIALTEAAYYALLSDPPSAADVIARASEALVQAQPVDAGDAVALGVADDLLAFLAAANGKPYTGMSAASVPFSRLLQHRRGLVSLELAGVAAGNARRGATEGTTAFETAIDTLTRDGPRFEARLARAYAATFIRPKPREARPLATFDLTARESEILGLLVEGLSNKEIAQRLVVSPRTIETHVERVLGKLEVGSRSRAIAKALRLRLVSLD